jgi:membrane-bound lytic murein transglycosylase C
MQASRLLLVSLTLLVGCESTDRVLTNAERVLGTRTSRIVLDVATGKDPKQILKERVDTY